MSALSTINSFMLTGVVVNCEDKAKDGRVWGGEALLKTVTMKGRGNDRHEEVITIPVKYFGEQASKFPLGREVLITGVLSGRAWGDKHYPEILVREVVVIGEPMPEAKSGTLPLKPPAAKAEPEGDMPF